MSEAILSEDISNFIKKDEPVKLNIGCGDNKLEGYINIDSNPRNKPDIALDILKGINLGNESVDEIVMFHTIEHIQEKLHSFILGEFHRLLKPEGTLYISYPEFKVCANNYIRNYQGLREFWKYTIYGLQRDVGDFHVSLMDTDFFVETLQEHGFRNIQYQPEINEPYNTIIRCCKGEQMKSYEDLLRTNMI